MKKTDAHQMQRTLWNILDRLRSIEEQIVLLRKATIPKAMQLSDREAASWLQVRDLRTIRSHREMLKLGVESERLLGIEDINRIELSMKRAKRRNVGKKKIA